MTTQQHHFGLPTPSAGCLKENAEHDNANPIPVVNASAVLLARTPTPTTQRMLVLDVRAKQQKN
jgi:hypothetical protein